MNVKVIGNNNYLGDLKEEFFLNRGIKNHYDFITLKGLKHTNPFEFTNMEEAVSFLLSKEGCNIGIVVDSDADGLSSASELHNYFETYLDYNVKMSIHRTKTHGIKMTELEEDGILDWADILIVPDAGSSDYEEHKRLKNEYGITTIVIDHHVADYRSRDAIVVNNQLDNISVNLTGSALAYKFLQAIDMKIGENGAENFIDLCAIGLIGDMADNRDLEVQYLIRNGLSNIQNMFFKTIIEDNYSIKENDLKAISLAFSLIPMINACTRVSTYEEMKIVIDAMCNIGVDRTFEYEFKKGKNKGQKIQENLYEYAHRVATRCRTRQKGMVDKALVGSSRPKKEGILSKLSNDDVKNPNQKIIVVDATDYIEDSGLSGLVANKIMYIYNKPVIVFIKKKVGYLGSARGEQIAMLRTRLEESNLFEYAQGHEPACGVRLLGDKTPEQISKELNKYFENENTEAQYVVDFSIPSEYMEDYIVEELSQLEEFFGTGIKTPLIHVSNLIIKTNSVNTGKNSNIFSFYHNYIEFMKFNVNEDIIESLLSWDDYCIYDVVCKPNINEYNGRRTVQLVIEAIELVGTENSGREVDDESEEFEW